MTKIYLQNCACFDGLEIQAPLSILLDDQCKILAVNPVNVPEDARITDCFDVIAVPGFFDLQVNGGKGYFFNDDPSFETARHIQEAHQAFGTKDILMTFITDQVEKWDRLLNDWSDPSSWPKGIAGIHLEGPFLSPKRPGVHSVELIRRITEADVATLIQFKEKIGERVLLLTVAPEEVATQSVKRLADAGIILFAGHSNATFEEAMAFFDAGGRGVTHLFNAMSGLSARDPGLIGAVLANSDVSATLIADGFHVHESMLRLAKQTRSIDQAILVSDAMPSAAGGPSTFTLQGSEIHTESGRSLTAKGVLSGSAVTLLESICYAHKVLGWSLEDCLRTTYTSPRLAVGLETKAMPLQVGEKFDAILLHKSLETVKN